MYATNITNLKRNPSEALKHAESEPVLILKNNEPNAMIFNLKNTFGNSNEQLKLALAASLFKSQVLSLEASAKISGLALSEFIVHLGQLDIDVAVADKQTAHELETINAWLL